MTRGRSDVATGRLRTGVRLGQLAELAGDADPLGRGVAALQLMADDLPGLSLAIGDVADGAAGGANAAIAHVQQSIAQAPMRQARK